MGFELRVFMTGLGLFVPKRGQADSDQIGLNPEPSPITEIQMLMVNGLTDQPIEEGLGTVMAGKTPPRRFAPHRPLVQYNPSNQRGNRPNYPLFQDKAGNSKGIWFLEKSTLCLSTTPGGKLPRLVADFNEMEIPETQGELNTLRWISPIAEEGERQPIDERFLDDRLPDDLHDQLSARFHISNGCIRVASLAAGARMSREGDQQVQAYQFGKHPTRETATVVELSVWVDAMEICLVKKPFGSPERTWDHLILGPNRRNQVGDRDDLVEIWVMNEELDSVFQVRS